jgi:hypothetical protein
MSSTLSFPEQQQRLQNILSVGNLWYQRKSAIALENMSEVQSVTIEQNEKSNEKLDEISGSLNDLSYELSDLNYTNKEQLIELKKQTKLQHHKISEDRLTRIKEETRRIKEENIKKENEYLRDAFFHLTIEIKELEMSNINNLEKYFSIMSINYMMKKYNISTKLTKDLNEKKIINDALEKIIKLEKKVFNKFSNQEKIDLDSIYQIMETNKKPNIKNLKREKSYLEKLPKRLEKTKKSYNLFEIVSNNIDIVKRIKY